eukprot:TRINITY_DN45228_c0_g1_i1.p1 TRINITY_DN45228_c0_g1~~TRINITY_DN45228_c0_g1_i1.p1  ORF type:complete len:1115 (+),score=307.20 TRINITY_DN45228_c0_g1_i1:231-3575(+)
MSVASATANANTDVFAAKAWELLIATRLELSLFVAAVLAYFALFGNVLPTSRKSDARSKAKKLRHAASGFSDYNDEDEDVLSGDLSGPPPSSEDCKRLENAFQAAYDAGDLRAAVRHWHSMKRFDRVPQVSLAKAIEALQRIKKDATVILNELKAFFRRYPDEIEMSAINDLLESLARRHDNDLMDKVVALLPSCGLERDARSYEVYLGMHFTSRSFKQVQDVVAQMRAKKIPLTTRATIVVIKTALRQSDIVEARRCFRELKAAWASPANSMGAGSTPSQAPRHIVSLLVELACKEHQLAELLPELRDMPVTEEAVNTMFAECAQQQDGILAREVERLARDQHQALSDRTYGLMLKAYMSSSQNATRIFDEVLARNNDVSSEISLAAIAVAEKTGDAARVHKLRSKLKSPQLSVLSALVRFYTSQELYEFACDVYEKDVRAMHPEATDKDRRPRAQEHSMAGIRPTLLDARMERSLMTAALRCGRTTLAHSLLDSSPSDIAKHITMIRNCASSGNLEGAMSVFEQLRKSGTELNSVVYNTVLDACVECRNQKAAEDWMQKTRDAGMADVVSYNTLIKAHLAGNNFQRAREVMEEMKKDGLQPNRVTFNELINSIVHKGHEMRMANRATIWQLIDEMQAVGVKPNQVTCSILMKSLTNKSQENDIVRTMDLINVMEEPMDEVLLSSVVEACVRVGRPQLLASKLRQLQSSDGLSVNGSHTFGSLIKAYGYAKDVDGVWRCWKEMRSRHIRPTSITLGCMVEAVVNNGDTEGAYELIHQMQEDDRCKSALNSVIYCSVLKGFTREKKVERVWAVYEEMCANKVELSIVTYNTLIDACARSGRMDHVPNILQDMDRANIKPNVITYSTMLKGHCQRGDIQMGFKLLEQMKTDAKLRPDEIVYNSLLDGCAQNGLVDEGLSILEGMQKEGVIPSNFTLSVLVKLMSRARNLEMAFNLVEELSTKYKFQVNVHVYTNLIQACISNRALNRGIGVLQKMIKERVAPENRSYAILIRASLQLGQFEQANGLLRGALGLAGALPFLDYQAIAICNQLESALVNETLVGLAEHKDIALPLLAAIRQDKPKIRIDSATQRRLVMDKAFDGGPRRDNRGARGFN